jgi:hypothetical protein
VVVAVDAAAPDAAAGDAAIDAPVDAILDVPLVPIDAGHHRTVRVPVDAGRPVPRDGATVTATPPPPEPAAQGFGTLTAKTKGGPYLNVSIDGHVIGPTPMFGRKIPAGRHVIELVDPRTGSAVVQRTVTVGDGESVTVVEP